MTYINSKELSNRVDRAAVQRKFRLLCATGFTLIEVLMTVAIVSIMVALLTMASGDVQRLALKSRGHSNLRQVGLAVLSYAGDNNNRLPGPAPLGIYPLYNKANGGDWYIFATQLSPYLGLPPYTGLGSETVLVPVLVSPGMAKFGIDPRSVPNYVQNSGLTSIPGGRPFGTQANSSYAANQPLTLFDLANLGGASVVWALTDLDQQINDSSVRASGWYSSLPKKPIYKNCRLRLYFDGRVESVPLNAPNQ